MRKITYFILGFVLLLVVHKGFGQTTIVFQGFETGDTWGYSGTGSTNSTANRSGVNGYQLDKSEAITFDEVDVSSYSDVDIIIYCEAKNGWENADAVDVYVDIDNSGFPASPDIKVRGAQSNPFNTSWSYSASGIANTTAGTPATYTGAAGSDPNGYAKIVIDIPNGTNSIDLKIEGINFKSSNSEMAYIDDISIEGISGSPSPTITLSESALTAFSYVQGAGPSSEQSFTASGSNLTADITLTPPTNYEISTGTGASFVATNPITLTQSGGSVSSTTIYTRLKAGLTAGDYNSEDITASSTGATNQTVTCSGTVTAAGGTPTITLSESTLDFEKVYTGFSSLPQAYTVTGADLTADITVTAPSGIELAASCAGTYGGTLTLTHSGGSVNATVYARYTSGAVSANITHTSAGATTKNVSISEVANSTNMPAGYYSTATGTGATLKTNLKTVISSGHSPVSYTPGVWNAFYTTDAKPDGSVWDIYTDIPCGSPCSFTFGTDQDNGSGGTAECQKYNREHSFPASWFGSTGDAYTDLFHLMATDKYVNNQRSSYCYGEVTTGTTYNNGSKLGVNTYTGAPSNICFEPADAYKGDIARNYFYMATRYETDIDAWEGNDINSVGTSDDWNKDALDGTEYPCFDSWFINMLLAWHAADPVDQKEMTRNDAIYAIQGNRNPFIDNPSYVEDVWNPSVDPEPDNHPTVFTATANGSSQIDLSWTDATGTNLPSAYLIKGNTTGTFSDPVDGTDPSVDSDLSDGSAVVKVAHGAKGNYSFTGLSASTTYYFKIWSYSNSGSNIDFKTTGGTVPTDNATTDAAAGTCASEDFVNAGNTGSYTTINWSGSDGFDWTATDARSDVDLGVDEAIMLRNGSLTNDVSQPNGMGVLEFDYAQIYSGTSTLQVWVNSTQYGGDINVNSTSSNHFSVTVNVSGNVDVELRNSGNRTLVSNLQWSCYSGSSNDATSTVTAGAGSEPATIASTVDTDGEEIMVFDFIFTDAATSDSEPTIIDGIQITQGDNNAIADWGNAIAGAYLSGTDLSSDLAGTVNATNITFTSNDMISIASGANETYSLKIYLNTDLSSISDNDNLEFKLDYSNITADAAGSSFGSGAPESGNTNVAISITATQLLYVQQPSTTQVNAAMSPDPTVKACDVNGNVDTDYSTAISVTSSGTLTGTPVSGTWSSGVATFSSLTHTATGTALALTAASGALANEVSNTFDIEAVPITISQELYGTCPSTVWNTVDVLGSTDQWVCNAGTGIEINGYGDENDEDWLIIASPINFTAYSNEEMAFVTQEKYNGPDLELYYSSDFSGTFDASNVSSATWNSIAHTWNDVSSSGSYSSQYDNTVDLSSLTGTNYIAFKYTGTSSSAEGWLIDDIIITGVSANDLTSTVSAGAAAEPANISSTVTSSTGTQVFDFVFADPASGDGVNTIIDQLQITQGSANAVADWTNAIAGAVINGPDQTNMVGTVNATNITFASNDMITIADGASETYTLSIWLNTDLSGISDNDVLEFAMDFNNITADAAGSQFGSGAPESGNTNVAVDIVATKLLFVQQPTDTEAGVAMSPDPTVEATDANNNRDTDFSTAVTVSSTGTMTGDPVSGSWSSGVATFSSLTHTATGTGLTLSTSCVGVTDATSSTFDITGNSESDLIAVASSESVTVSSIENTSGPLTSTQGVQVWQFTIRDGGASSDSDNLPTIITGITLSQNVGNTMDDWDEAILSADLFEGSTHLATATINANTLEFTGSPIISVADNGSETLSLRISISTSANTSGNNNEGDDFVFDITNTDVTTQASGSSGFTSFTAASSTDGQNEFSVVATELRFAQQPLDANVNAASNPAPSVEATDANGNRDIDYATNISITSSSSNMTGDPITVAPTSGLSEFNSVVHTATETNVVLTASSGAFATVDSDPFDITLVTTLEFGDIVVVGVNSNTNSCVGGGAGADEISFYCFKDITQNTVIDITDNGWEREFADQWGDGEGYVRVTRSGSTIPAGKVITWRLTNASKVTGVHPDADWSVDLGVSVGNLILNTSGDQIFFMQGGTWDDGGAQGDNDATYLDGSSDPVAPVFGFNTNNSWNSFADDSQLSGLPSKMDCFSMMPGVATDFIKYTGPTTEAPQRQWISRINNADNWTSYANCTEYYDNGPNYTDGDSTFSIGTGNFEDGTWYGYRDSLWSQCGNWGSLVLPDSTIDVVMPSSGVLHNLFVDSDSSFKCHNLDLENTTYKMTGGFDAQLKAKGTVTFNGGSIDLDTTTTLIVEGDWSQDVVAAFDPGNYSTVQFAGADQTIALTPIGTQNINFHDFISAGTGTKTNTDDLTITGDLVINNNSTFDPSTNSTEITLSGDFTNNNSSAGFDGTGLTLLLNGSSKQTISSSVGSETIDRIRFGDGTAGASLLLGCNLTANYVIFYANSELDFGSSGARSFTVDNQLACAVEPSLVTIDMSGGAHNLYLNSGTHDIKQGTLSLSSTSTVYYQRAGSQTLLSDISSYAGNLVLGGTNGTNIKTIGNTPLTVGGDFTISGNAVASPSATSTINIGGSYNVWGDGAFDLTTNDHSVVLNGTASQSISGIETFHNLTLSNTAGFSLGDNINVDGALTFSNGVISTGANSINLGANGSLSSESETNYINGYVSATRNIGTGVAQSFGNIGMSITESSGANSTTVTRATGTGAVQTGNSCCASNESIERYFDVVPTSGVSNASMEFSYFDSELNGAAENELILFSASLPLSGSDPWTKKNGSVNTTTNIISLGGINSFSRWTAAPSSAPLPINLLAFTGDVVGHEIHLHWTTASEINNDYFTVEKSEDASVFLPIGTIQGSGNSSVLNDYLFIDDNPTQGVNYYKLKQTDLDGSFEYSDVIAVDYGSIEKLELIINNKESVVEAIVKNPNNEQPIVLEVFDITGKLVYEKELNFETSIAKHIISKEFFNKGIYLFNLKSDKSRSFKKVGL